MENVIIQKSELLRILRANRAKHRSIFEEACDGYQKEAERLLAAALARIKAGQRTRVLVSIAEPQDQTKDYDRAIRMMELHIPDDVQVSEQDFAQYVMDEWVWKHQFLSTNSAYSSTAMSFLADAQ